VRVEGWIAIVVIFLCWFVGIFLYEEDMSLTRYAIIAILIMLAPVFLFGCNVHDRINGIGPCPMSKMIPETP
jgi:hypothetical protein